MRTGSVITTLTFVCLSLGLLTSPAAGQATLLVPADYPTIQEAIDAAVDGQTVLVSPDTYFETIVILDKAISIESIDGAEVTVIDGTGCTAACSVVRFESADSVLDGFTVTHGTGSVGPPPNLWGGGIYCLDSDPTIRNCIIQDNQANYGGGAYFYNSNAVIIDNVFRDNELLGPGLQRSGGGLFAALGWELFISGNTFIDNAAQHGGGVHFNLGGGTISDNTFENNFTENSGAGLQLFNALPTTISGNTFSGNHTDGGGGAIGVTNTETEIVGNTIVGNIADWGGGVWVENGVSVTLESNTFSSNRALGGFGEGGGLDVDYPAFVTMTNCVFSGNIAQKGGGLNYYQGGTGLVTNCSFSANTASVEGGAIRCQGFSSTPTITNCILWGGGPDRIVEVGGAAATVTYCDIEGGWPGVGNLDQDPLFVATDDVHLLAGSPCIDAGTNAAPALPATDFEGDDRIICSTVDMGADETLVPPGGCLPVFVRGDVNQDALFDIADAIFGLGVLFVPDSLPPDCLDAADANDDGAFDIGDPITTLNTLFGVGTPLSAPYPDCGADPTPNGLGCAAFTPCP